ncbi:protein CASC3 [Harmonia axyridis]|uniref:protein CASC3 n=1 Tax=Harmonia axyridis TaxID=115357 RepID=UPI001E275E1D|nr:protein CASC3 [Harmonia axyridis]
MEENPESAKVVEPESPLNSVEEENTSLQIDVGSDDKNQAIESEEDIAPGSQSEEELKQNPDYFRSENDTDVEENEGSLILERQEGDGQESIPQKAAKVDDDEDKKNPQYIPKRGTFYEHDDRTADDIEAQENAEKEKIEKEGKKKLWQDKKERWSHDRFNDQEQAPKSKTELVQIYGYDIRNEDGPPRARRRRRYGRGPNKYTRNWKDEDAYNKTVPQKPQKKIQKPPSEISEEFPPLVNDRKEKSPEVFSEQSECDINRTVSPKQFQNNTEVEERNVSPQKEKTQGSFSTTFVNSKLSEQSSLIDKTHKVGSGRVSKSKQVNSGRYESSEPSRIDVSDYKGFTTKVRMSRNFKNQNINNKNQKKENHSQYQNYPSNKKGDFKEQKEDGIENAMASMSIQEPRVTDKGNPTKTQNRQGSVPPRMQGEQKGSKRYSSIRQRSLPEANNPPVLQHTNYFANDLSQAPQPQATVGTVIHQNPNLLQTPATITQLGAPPSIPLAQVPAPNAPILQAPPQFAPAYAQPAAFIQAAVPPPTFLQQQAPPIINYVQTTPQYPAGYQNYPYQQTQSTELYQPQGGITYYSTDQQIAQRTVPPKRPKAAIPIVAPPSLECKKGDEERKVEYTADGNIIE